MPLGGGTGSLCREPASAGELAGQPGGVRERILLTGRDGGNPSKATSGVCSDPGRRIISGIPDVVLTAGR